jgi:hypothetical protein
VKDLETCDNIICFDVFRGIDVRRARVNFVESISIEKRKNGYIMEVRSAGLLHPYQLPLTVSNEGYLRWCEMLW